MLDAELAVAEQSRAEACSGSSPFCRAAAVLLTLVSKEMCSQPMLTYRSCRQGWLSNITEEGSFELANSNVGCCVNFFLRMRILLQPPAFCAHLNRVRLKLSGLLQRISLLPARLRTIVGYYYIWAHCTFHKCRQRLLLPPQSRDYICPARIFSWGDIGKWPLHGALTKPKMTWCYLETLDGNSSQGCDFHDFSSDFSYC